LKYFPFGFAIVEQFLQKQTAVKHKKEEQKTRLNQKSNKEQVDGSAQQGC
jgi:hypothetical protein